jgi:hypothetical protein
MATKADLWGCCCCLRPLKGHSARMEPLGSQVWRCNRCGYRNYIPGGDDPAPVPPPSDDDDRETVAPGDEHYYRIPGAADR